MLKRYLTTSRNRLIDLTKRNKLINFNLNAKQPRHFDVVSASLSQVWEAVSSGSSIPISFVPEPKLQTDLVTGEDLPMPKAIDRAKECGIDPSLELSVKPDCKEIKLKTIQTLLYYSHLERLIQKLRDDARAANEEKGVSTLHCMVGFLQWMESKDSSITITSPLLLAQVELEIVRQALPNQRFLLSGQESDQDSWVVNPSLRIKLQNDYGIELPLLEQGEFPAAYFERVRSMLSAHPKWSISHRVAIGNIAFPRLAIYEDLDFHKWESEGGNLLFDHPILTGLLSGICREPSDKERQEEDEDGITTPIKGLVFDADSSQIETIRRVLAGETMTLEGPPGTGKSQTIANLISAYLFCGKRVLFVADKKAAVDVVEQRLTRAGLNEFCLNLHNDSKQSKAALYDKLAKRLEIEEEKKRFQPIDWSYQEATTTVSSLTSTLDSYYDTLRISPQETQSSLYDLLWISLQSREEYDGLPSQIKKINISSALTISPTMLEISKGLLGNLESAVQTLDISPKELKNHVLWAFTGDLLDPFQADEINQCILGMGEKLGKIVEILGAWQGFHDVKTMSLEDCLHLEQLRPLQEISINEELYRRLVNQHDLRETIKTLKDMTDQFPSLLNSNNPTENLRQLSDVIKQKITYLKSPLATEFGNCCAESAESLRALTLRLNQFSTFLAQACPNIYARSSNKWAKYAREIQIILDYSENLDDQLVQLIQNGLSRGLDWEQVDSVAKLSCECDRTYEELKEIFSTDLLYDDHRIEQLSVELLTPGYFRRFSYAWRRAYQQLSEQFVVSKKMDKRTLLHRLRQLQKWSQAVRLLKQKKIDIGLVSNGIILDMEAMSKLLRLREEERQLELSASSVYSEAVKSGRTLLDIQSLNKSCFGEDALNILTHLSSYLNDSPTCHIEDLIQKARRELETTESLAKSLKVCELSDDGNSSNLHLLSMSLNKFFGSKELVTLISSWSIEKIIQGAESIDAVVSAQLNKKNRKILATVHLKNLAQVEEIVALAEELTSISSHIQEMGFIISIDGKKSDQILLLELAAWQKHISAELPKLTDWWKFRQALTQLEQKSLSAHTFVKQLMNEKIPLKDLSRIFNILVARNKVISAIRGSDSTTVQSSYKMHQIQRDFQTFDRRMINSGAKWTQKALLSRNIDPGSRLGRRGEWTGFELVRHELGKQKKRIPPRKLLKRGLEALQDLMPCFMMSPLNAAQYLPVSQKPLFDLVIIDEASQLKPEEAFSAIIRGSQLLVVGDSKQLPPTSFFNAVLEDEEEDDEEAIDNESILDMAKATFSSHSLRWHYRSKHDSLIYFSNQQFYDGRLIVCPSSEGEHELLGVHLFRADGLYKNGENLEEASLVAEKAIMCMKTAPHQSIGIVAMNRQQKELIQTLLYQARCASEEVNSYLEDWEEKNEHCFVKNLESVQGDERDIILISTVYGPTERGGKVLRRFGPINSIHGHRRLNVLCTRARSCMYVITSLQPSDILPPGDSPTSKGIEAFAKFLEFAGSGQRLTEVVSKEPDSPFEEFVGSFLSDSGYDVHYQIGQSGFRIDIGIRHPIHPYGFIAGIECDGAAYHSHKTARDRDRLRQEILENHGWKIYRIWSTDWFYQPKQEKQKLLDWLSKRVSELKQQRSIEVCGENEYFPKEIEE